MRPSKQTQQNNLLNNNSTIPTSNKEEDEDEKIYAYGIQLVGSCALPMVLNATIEMGVLQFIHDHHHQVGPPHQHGVSATEVAAHIGASNPEAPAMLDRILRLLATYSVVACTAIETAEGGTERRYRASPVTELFVPNKDGMSLAPLVGFHVNTVFLQSWSKLKEAVLEGGVPFNMVHGMNAFEYCAKDSSLNEVFHKLMCQSTLIINEILDNYKGFENVRKLVDVGGSLGHILRAIIAHYPSIKGINFDLPHVIKSAPSLPGVEHVGGDMFESVPKGDTIFMKWILHDWSDEHCLKLLKNCYNALPDKGKVIVVESILPEKPESTNIARAISQIDLVMMTQHIGGKERTMREFEALAKGAGFASIKLHGCARACWVIEFYK